MRTISIFNFYFARICGISGEIFSRRSRRFSQRALKPDTVCDVRIEYIWGFVAATKWMNLNNREWNSRRVTNHLNTATQWLNLLIFNHFLAAVAAFFFRWVSPFGFAHLKVCWSFHLRRRQDLIY